MKVLAVLQASDADGAPFGAVANGGHELMVTEDVREALSLLANHQFEMVVFDTELL